VPLPPLAGHAPARAVLGRAAVAGTLPQSILLHGPAGIGKERLGLWLGQLLLCTAPAAGPEPCRHCHSCSLVERLQHPDLHWFFPLPRPEGAAGDRLRDKLEEARGAELAARRADPLHLPAWEKPPAHFLAAVQTLQRIAANRPAMGDRKVFVVGDAELMVPQESSPEAANAFLKLLEEPPADTTLVLTTERPGALLATILSRVLPVRLTRLPESEVREFLVGAGAAAGAEAERIAAMSQGAVGRALRLLPGADGAGGLERSRRHGRELLEAVLSASPVPRLAAAHAVAPAGGRAYLVGVLDALSEWLRDLSAVAAGTPHLVLNRDGDDFLRRSVESAGLHPLVIARALRRIDPARECAEGNVNPQLILADLLCGLQADLRGPAR
jgi:DNA polymerase III subunit delta'